MTDKPQGSTFTSTIRQWLPGIGVSGIGSVFKSDLPFGVRFVWGMVSLCCIILSFFMAREEARDQLSLTGRTMRNLLTSLRALLGNYWSFLLIPFITVGIVLIIATLFSSPLPSEVIEARLAVIEIQHAFSGPDVGHWWVSEDQNQRPNRKFVTKEKYEIIMAENMKSQDQPLRTYIKQGKRIAEDAVAPESYAFIRRYYRGTCNFATDYFDMSGRPAFLVYDKDCKGTITVPETVSQIFPQPVPLIAFRY